MSPLTRMQADQNLAPTDMNAAYYCQRASAGLKPNTKQLVNGITPNEYDRSSF